MSGGRSRGAPSLGELSFQYGNTLRSLAFDFNILFASGFRLRARPSGSGARQDGEVDRGHLHIFESDSQEDQ
jgi:hypothetical protein